MTTLLAAATLIVQQFAFTSSISPYSIAVDNAGNAYIASQGAFNSEIDRVSPSGQVTKFADGTGAYLTFASDGALWARTPVEGIVRFGAGGSRMLVPIDHVRGLAASPDAGMWFATDDATIGFADKFGVVSRRMHEVINDTRFLSVARDGSVWFAGPYSDVARIDAEGSVNHFTFAAKSHIRSIAGGRRHALARGRHRARPLLRGRCNSRERVDQRHHDRLDVG